MVKMIRLLGALGLLVAPAPALAAEPWRPITARLTYTRPPGCPAESELRYEVARQLGEDPFIEEGIFRAVVTVTREKNRLAGSLKIYDGDGQMFIDKHTSYPAWDCATLVSGLAISLTVYLDPQMGGPAALVKAPPGPSALPAPSPVPLPALLPARLPPKEEAPLVAAKPPAPLPARWRGVVGLGPQVAFGPVGQAFGLAGDLGVRWPVLSPKMAFSLGAEFRYALSSSAPVEERPGATFKQKFSVGGALVSCLHWQALFVCAVASGGVLSVAPEAADKPAGPTSVLGYVRAGGRFGFEQALQPWLALRFSSEGLGALRPLYVATRGVDVGTPVLSFPLSGAITISAVAFFGGPR